MTTKIAILTGGGDCPGLNGAIKWVTKTALDPKLVDGAVAQRLGQRPVDQAVLVEQREPVEARARHGHLEVVAAAGAVLDEQLRRVGKRVAEQGLQALGHHVLMLVDEPWRPVERGAEPC